MVVHVLLSTRMYLLPLNVLRIKHLKTQKEEKKEISYRSKLISMT